jgi:dihydroxyacid dehydratase/phosphogluconate dehydratase
MRPLMKSAVQSSSARMRRSAKEMSKRIDRKFQKPLDSSGPLSSAKMKQLRNGTKPDPDAAQNRDSSGQRGKASIDFAKASTSVPKSVNDIVQAPPQINHLPRNAKKIVAASGKGKKSDAVISMAQKASMEVERENAIQRYRELKERRLKQNQKNLDADS